jgi:hypothetical protein
MSESDSWFATPSGRRADGDRPSVTYEVHMLPRADDKSLQIARRQWGPSAQESDFERVGKTWVDKATGTIHHRIHGNPLAGYDTTTISAYYVADGHLIFLRAVDTPEQVTGQRVGELEGRLAGPREARPVTLEETVAELATGRL